MSPIANAILQLQEERRSYLAYQMLLLFSIRKKLQDIMAFYSQNIIKMFIAEFITTIEKRFGKFFKCNLQDTEVNATIMAAVSHPGIKTSFTKDENVLKLIKDNLVYECQRISEELIFSQPSSTSTAECEGIVDTFIENNSAFMSNEVVNVKLLPQQIEAVVHSYLAESRADLHLLKKSNYKILMKVFLKYNTIMPTSVPSERLFSIGPLTSTPGRSNIKPNMLGILMFLKGNKKYF